MTQFVVPNSIEVCASLNIQKPENKYPYALIRYSYHWNSFKLIRGTSRKDIQLFLDTDELLTLGLLPHEAKPIYLNQLRQEAKHK